MPRHHTDRRPWTDDTRIAFLLALRLHGSATRAAAAIGRIGDSCYGARRRNARFAADWDAVVLDNAARKRAARTEAQAKLRARTREARLLDAGNPDECDASGNRRRWTGLTQVRRRAFLRALAETGTVATACRVALVSDSAVYRLRGDDADFAADWDRALRTAAPALEQVAWERAVEGWEEPVFRGGEQVGTKRRYSETLLRQLLIKRDKAAALAADPPALVRIAHEAARAAGGEFHQSRATAEETDAAILAALARIDARTVGRGGAGPDGARPDGAGPEAAAD